ncbi:hypothetical protein [Streptomyces sp. enrichment culture]|uniref:hypothetical protein n=1 Tax=Streptomyces sp. enrichment culture TaxID=1795815 RepID=UPI003F558623
MTTAGGLRLFLDRSTNARRFAEAARELCSDVQTIGDLYGVVPAEAVMDEQLIPLADIPGPWVCKLTKAGLQVIEADVLTTRLEQARARFTKQSG